jgi:TonB family protein
VVQKGENAGKKHGQYANNARNNRSSGRYYFNQKNGKWSYSNNTDEYLEYYSKGRLDSIIGKRGTTYFSLILDQKGDTAHYEYWYPNGISYRKTGDTTLVSNRLTNTKIGKLVNGNRHGQWYWTTNTGSATTKYKNGESVGTHESFYRNGALMCQKNFNDNGKLHGNYFLFYENGDTAVYENFTNGKRHGSAKAWYNNGRIFYNGVYSKDKLIEYQENSKNGNLNTLSFVKGGKGSVIHKIDETTITYPIVNGIIDGIVTKATLDSTITEKFVRGIKQLKNEDKCSKQEDVDTKYIHLNYQSLDSSWLIKANFPKDEMGLQRFLSNNISYPNMAMENDVQGTVHLQFTINHLGQVINIETCKKTLGFGLEEESKRVIQTTSYHWTPSTINGFPWNMRFRMPLKYQIF